VEKEAEWKLFPSYATADRFDSLRFLGFVLIHLAVIAAPLVFSWAGLIACAAMTIAIGQFGVIGGYHRMLTHGGFTALPPLRYALALLGTLGLQRGPISWAAIHRYHHVVSDRDADPHSPRVSILWAHLLWPFFEHPDFEKYNLTGRPASDLEHDSGLRFLERFHYPIAFAFAGSVFGAGCAVGGAALGLSLVIWGYFIPVVYTWQMMLLGASVNHVWGYRNYATPDDSRNTWWIALLSFGDGWHNNHHAHPRSAAHGHRWFELDVTYWIILAMERLGLAQDVVRRPKAQEERRRAPCRLNAEPRADGKNPADRVRNRAYGDRKRAQGQGADRGR
jgi:stearoyl-CoA desaturase (delta-9 desaturase)